MIRRGILTAEVLATIPALVAQGLRKSEIAERLGCKEATLQVRCSNAGISLRPRKKMQLRPGSPLTLSRDTLTSLRARAGFMGCTESELVSDLLKVIAQDNLYDAVLDSAPLQPGPQESIAMALPAGSTFRTGKHLKELS
ncbi:hypothetical protein ACRQ5Q_41525 (plasmid) [Bradyrhizobium sp. PMVTL-01]|uniref:hypothetical protein n=1 Tax=Bradyrhizobium sp. PMVTL-01 TaxID=3434999 RepID=UPI003F7122A9